MSDIKTGISCLEAISYSQQDCFLDKLFSDAIKDELPAPDSDQVAQELSQTKKYIDQYIRDPELIQRYEKYDRQFEKHIEGFLLEDNSGYQQKVMMLFKDVTPLVYKIKFHYQRPRPAELLCLHKEISFHPVSSLTAQCPAYPSYHSCMGYVLYGVLGNLYPHMNNSFKSLATDIYCSRLFMGLCLVTDVDGGIALGKQILADKEFIVKYGL